MKWRHSNLWSRYDLHVVGHGFVLREVNWWRFVKLFKWNWIIRFKKSAWARSAIWLQVLQNVYISLPRPAVLAAMMWGSIDRNEEITSLVSVWFAVIIFKEHNVHCKTVWCKSIFLGRLFDRVDLIKTVSNVRSSVRPGVRTYVRACVTTDGRTQSFFDFNEIWHVDRGRWVMHNGMQYDPIQGQGQGNEPLKVGNLATFKGYLLPIYYGGWQMTTDS